MKTKVKARKVDVRKHRKKAPHQSVLKSLPLDSSSLTLAYQLTEKVSRLGFDWPNLKGVLKKLNEEMREFREALSLRNRRRMHEEMGDLLFVLVNLSRFLRIDPEEALRKTVEKFISRFEYIETSLQKKRKAFHQSNLTEMDQLWEEAKKRKKRMAK